MRRGLLCSIFHCSIGRYRIVLRCISSIAAGATLLAISACVSSTVPSSNAADSALQVSSAYVNDGHSKSGSILEKLNKDVLIGSTVDAANGDKGPRAISIAPGSHKGTLTKGQLLVCNFEDSSGVPGNGSTMEVLNPTPGSTPARFIQNASITGCDGDAIQPNNGFVYGAGVTSGDIVEIGKSGKVAKTYSGKGITAPLADSAANHTQDFAPLFIYAGTTAGGIVSISVGFYGNGLATQVVKGFAVSTASGQYLGPTALPYDQANDTLFVVDGASNTVVAISNASKLLDKDEIIVKHGGTTFECKHPQTTCASLVYSGAPLDAPIAATLFPNGNLVIANSQGAANTLVELTPQGQVLATKVVDPSSTQGISGLAARGTNDNNAALYFTDTNSNTVQELER